jgi:hypothetical protein
MGRACVGDHFSIEYETVIPPRLDLTELDSGIT